MLNPSTADELQLDPSCTRARNFAEGWGYGALVVTNLFSFRETSPEKMKAARDPVGPGNDAAILRAAREAAIVVCSWGNHGLHQGRAEAVVKLLRTSKVKLFLLKKNQDGQPAHPLYLRGDLKPVRW